MGINVKTGEITFGYAHVWAARANKQGVLKFSVCCMVDKSSTADVKMYHDAMKAAFDEGVTKGYFTPNQWEIVKKPLRDGDDELRTGIKKGDEWKNRIFFNANTGVDDPPSVAKPLNGKVVLITDESEFYSGCKGRAAVSFYPFKGDTARGIAVGLNHVMKTGEGERLDGRESVDSAFSEFATDAPNLESDNASMTTGDAPKRESDPFN